MGKVREINEDSCCCHELNGDLTLIIVADGMGGHNAGEVASGIAVKSIADYIKSNLKDNITIEKLTCLMNEGIQNANSDIYTQSMSNPGYAGMGTTVTAAIVGNDDMVIGHVGDSRAYILKDGKLGKITNDHSLVAELVKNGTITEDEAMHHPQKNIITRALGTENSVKVDIGHIHIKADDCILLCTDGLSNMLCDREIEEILLGNSDIEAAVREMVDKANNAGGYDNITVVIAKQGSDKGGVRQ
jgi:Serine/threonine protein phosphatase